MNTLSLLLEKPLRAAVLAALSFALAVLCASVSSLGFDPAQYPLGLLPGLPGGEGGAYRMALYLLPAVLLLCVLAAIARRWSSGRAGRLALMLLGLSVAGFAGMGIMPLSLQALTGEASRWHAACWLFWLASWLAGLGLLTVASWKTGRHVLAMAGLGGILLVAALAGGWLTVVSGPFTQLLAWGVWFVFWMGLAELEPVRGRGF